MCRYTGIGGKLTVIAGSGSGFGLGAISVRAGVEPEADSDGAVFLRDQSAFVGDNGNREAGPVDACTKPLGALGGSRVSRRGPVGIGGEGSRILTSSSTWVSVAGAGAGTWAGEVTGAGSSVEAGAETGARGSSSLVSSLTGSCGVALDIRVLSTTSTFEGVRARL